MTGNEFTSRAKRLALFIPSLSGGGAERNFINLSAEFLKKDYEIDLIVCSMKGAFANQVPHGVRVVDLRRRRVSLCFPGLLRYIARSRPDLMMSSINHANIAAIIAKLISRHRFKLFVRESNTITDVIQVDSSLKNRIIPHLIRVFYRYADGVIAISEGVRDRLISVMKTDRGIHTIPNPVLFPEIERLQAEEIRSKAASGRFILSVGRLHPQKDFETLIRAFSKIAKRNPDVNLIILGTGELRRSLQNLIAEQDVGSQTHILGFKANPYPFFRRATLFALTSRWEGFGNVIVEAMHFGVPSVLTACQGGPRQLIQEGVNGFLSPVGDVDSVAANLQRALDTKWDRETIHDLAQAYRSDAIAARYLEAFGEGKVNRRVLSETTEESPSIRPRV